VEKLHNEELNDLFSSPDIVRVIKSTRVWLAVHVDRMMTSSVIYRVLVGKREGQRPRGRPSRMWEVNI